MKRRLLISARDPGAAAHLSAVAREAIRDGDWQVTVLVSPPADTVFARARVPFQRVNGVGEVLRRELQQILASAQPDVVLAGLSGPDAGLDEMVLELSEGRSRYLFQDYWGDLNPATPSGVEILCLDRAAAIKTAERHGRAGRIAGSPAHDGWPSPLRARKHHSVSHRVPRRGAVIGLCDQPLWHLPAYGRSLRRAVRALPPGTLLVRPHPRTDAKGRLKLRRLIGEARGWGDTLWAQDGPLPAFLARCDLLLSVFSNCALDAARYSSHAGHPGVLPFNLMFERDMRTYYEACSGFDRTPLADAGMAWDLRKKDDLAIRLSRALEPGVRYRYRRRLRADATQEGARAVLKILRGGEP